MAKKFRKIWCEIFHRSCWVPKENLRLQCWWCLEWHDWDLKEITQHE